MGWCHAFGPQIREGCDRAMVAGHDSCTCAECGAVCFGRFPGCASVWAAGPRTVTLTRPPRELGNPRRAAPATGPDPTGASLPVSVAHPAGTLGVGRNPTVEPGTENPDVRALRVDMQLLLWKVDRLHQQASSGDQLLQAAKELGAVAAALPQQVHQALSDARELQRQETRALFDDLRCRVLDDIAQVRETLHPAADAPGPAATVADLDERFEWLVEAVSDRFVALGNGLARVERRLTSEGATDPATNGAGSNGPQDEEPVGDPARA